MTYLNILITYHADCTLQLARSLSDYLQAEAYDKVNLSDVQSSLPDFNIWIALVNLEAMQTASFKQMLEKTKNQSLGIIVLALEDIDLPLALVDSFYLKFKDVPLTIDDEVHPRIQELLDQLANLCKLFDKIATLNKEKQDLSTFQANSLRVQYRLNEIEEQICYIEQLIKYPLRIHRENQTLIEDGIAKLIERRKQIHKLQEEDHNIQRIIGNPPQGNSPAFKGRDTEIAAITNYLLGDKETRIISIVGTGGVGKTALACKVMDSVARENSRLEGILYLSAENRNNSINLERIFSVTGQALGNDIQDALNRVWKNERMDLETQIDYLIDEYVEHPCLLLFDNLEDSLDDVGQFLDLELQILFDKFLERDHQARIIVTSRINLAIRDKHLHRLRILPLSDGLPIHFAIELLHDFDPDDTLGLQSANRDILKTLAGLTQGYPRALEAIAGILANQPRLSLIDLMQRIPASSNADITEIWVHQAEAELDADQRMVMQALAIFARPVNITAIRFLLDPYIPMTGIDIKRSIERLARGRYITINHSTGDISIHPLDKAYNYDLIAQGQADIGKMSAGERFLRQMNILPPVEENTEEAIFTQYILEKRAGDYYAQLRGHPSEWQTINDLEPYFQEYEHRLRAGDNETSFTMLITIYNLLKMSGFSRKIVDMINPILTSLNDTYLMTCYNMLGMAYDDLGRYQDALDCHTVALPLARAENNRPAEAAHLSGMGLQFSNLGAYEKALEHYELALIISRETGKRKQERGILNNMAVVYNSLGRKLQGLQYYQESLAIAREIDDKQGMAVTLANIGDAYGALGKVEKTIEYYQESVNIYNEIGDKLGRGVTIGKMGNAAIMLGSYDDALKLLRVAVGIAEIVGNRMWEVLHQADIAAVYAHQDNLDDGLHLLNELIPIAHEISSPILLNYTHSLLAGMLLYAGEFENARLASETALQYVNPANRHYEHALYGTILIRLGRLDEAHTAFNTALDHAAELLDNTSDLYSPKYSRGLSLMGLAICTHDMSYAEDAKDAYIEARKNCDAKGIVTREMKKLRLLTGASPDESPPDSGNDTFNNFLNNTD